MVDEQRDRNHLPQKHYLGVLARAAWFAYLNPKDTDLLYYNWFRRRDNWSPTEDLFDKGLFKICFHNGSRDFTSESVDWFATYRPEITPETINLIFKQSKAMHFLTLCRFWRQDHFIFIRRNKTQIRS